MDRELQHTLEILNAVGDDDGVTQRALAERLGVALGLANLYLRRLVTKGHIKIREFPRKPAARKRLRYLVTPKGLAEKTRLTYAYMNRSLTLYRLARVALREALGSLPERGLRRVALYGTGEPAELAYLTLKELGIEPVGVFDRKPGQRFLGMPVRDSRELTAEAVDRVVLATFDKPKLHVPDLLAAGVPADKIVTLAPGRKRHAAR